MPDQSNNSNPEASTPFPAGNGCPGWKFLYHSVCRCLVRDKGNIVIETGSNGGFSTIAMAQAIRDSGASGHIYSWEISDDNRCRAQRNISQADLAALADGVAEIRDAVTKGIISGPNDPKYDNVGQCGLVA
jgi:predicted O-methyltransferase YrrM